MEVETEEGTSMKAKYWNKRKKMKAKSNTWENNVKMKCPRILHETYLSVFQLTMYMNLVPLQPLITAVEYDVRTLLIPEKPMISFYHLKREIQ